jgi:hypothetical protein
MAKRPDNSVFGIEPPPEREPFRPPWPKGCPEPGIYPGESYEWYKAIPAVNATALKAGVALSPLHMRQAIEGHLDDSSAKKFGRAAHCRFLEPLAFAERFKVARPCSAPLKSGDREGQPCGVSSSLWDFRNFAPPAWFCKKHGGDKYPDRVNPGEYIQQDEADRIERMWQAVVRHPVVVLLRAAGGSEVSIVWEREGLPCKARLDKLTEPNSEGIRYILDLKKCTAWKIDRHSIDQAIANYHYDLQAAWYVSGVKKLLGCRVEFAWIFAEDGPPFDVRPKKARKGWLACGRFMADCAFAKYRWARECGVWEGVSPDWDTDEPPKWHLVNNSVAV